MALGKRKERVVVLSAHSDDFVIGAGGTIARYTREGKTVTIIILSYGERSHPWLKGKVVRTMRAKEAHAAGKLLHCKIAFFTLREGHFLEDYAQRHDDLLKILHRIKPTKIFTHSNEDPHPDHRSTHTLTLRLIEKLVPKPEIYVYSIWNPVSFNTQFPALYVDVSSSFAAKLKALKLFKSQKVHLAYPFLLLLYRGIKDGFKIKKRFGEHFFRIR